MKKLLTMFLCLSIILGLFPTTAWALLQWPSNISIEAEGGIVMDADTGTVLYGKNIHVPYFPASITKILTALIVIEQCDLDEKVTFSHNAVYNVEANSSSAGIDVGDELTVRDCLYALILKSANEAANALAEHVGGTMEGFAAMMNEKTKALGGTDSNFVNPSGLNNPNHYTSAYDMALIGMAAIQNPTFVAIDSALYYDLPPTKRSPEGYRIYPGHKMIKKNMPEYYPGAYGGKTGYTSLAGNTLVTFSKKNDMSLVTVILNGHSTHYKDTKKMLDFGYENFKSIPVADYETNYTGVENDMTIAGLAASELNGFQIDSSSKITLPKNADFSMVTSALSYDLTDNAPSNAIGKIQYAYGERQIGTAYLEMKSSSIATIAVPSTTIDDIASITLEEPAGSSPSLLKEPRFHISSIVWVILSVILVLGLFALFLIFFKIRQNKKEREARNMRRERRMQRFQDQGTSSAEFDLLMEQRRSYTATRPRGRRHRKFPF